MNINKPRHSKFLHTNEVLKTVLMHACRLHQGRFSGFLDQVVPLVATTGPEEPQFSPKICHFAPIIEHYRLTYMGEAEKQRQWTWWTEWHWKYSCVRVSRTAAKGGTRHRIPAIGGPLSHLSSSLALWEKYIPLSRCSLYHLGLHIYLQTGAHHTATYDLQSASQMDWQMWKAEERWKPSFSSGRISMWCEAREGLLRVSWHLYASGLWKGLVSKLWTASKVLWLLEPQLKR